MIKQWTNFTGLILFSIIFLCVLLVDIAIVYSYYRITDNFLDKQPQEITADAGIIFFGDYEDDNRKLGSDSRQRARAACELYRNGVIKSIICVGGYDIHRWRGKTHLMKKYLLEQGIPGNHIYHDSLSFNTITNWQEACKIIEYKRFKKVIAISAPLHIYRISRMIESEQVYYHAYQYKLQSTKDYWQVFKDVHREWVSNLLSLAFKDRLRNRVVHFYRTIRFEVDRVL